MAAKKRSRPLLVINAVNNKKQARANKHIDRPVQSYLWRVRGKLVPTHPVRCAKFLCFSETDFLVLIFFEADLINFAAPPFITRDCPGLPPDPVVSWESDYGSCFHRHIRIANVALIGVMRRFKHDRDQPRRDDERQVKEDRQHIVSMRRVARRDAVASHAFTVFVLVEFVTFCEIFVFRNLAVHLGHAEGAGNQKPLWLLGSRPKVPQLAKHKDQLHPFIRRYIIERTRGAEAEHATGDRTSIQPLPQGARVTPSNAPSWPAARVPPQHGTVLILPNKLERKAMVLCWTHNIRKSGGAHETAGRI